MLLIEQIKKDQVQARKDRNTDRASLLTTLYSEAAMIGKNDGGRETTDQEVILLMKKFSANAKEVMETADKNDKRFAIAQMEVVALDYYLPAPLTYVELQEAISTIIVAEGLSTMKDMGVIMKQLKSDYIGRYDGGTASKIIKELLK